MGEDYEVQAKLTFQRADRARRQAAALAQQLSNIGRRLSTARSGSSALMRRLIAVGGTYLGVRAVANAIERIGRSTFEAQSNVEDLTLSLATLSRQVEGVSFDTAVRGARRLYEQMEDIAVQSPGTARDLAGIFRMVYGPMRSAGVGMQRLLEFSRDAAAAGAALQVDYEQLSRDIGMMATGVAGTDVKTFRLLRSMRMLTETTEEWNQLALTDPTAAANRLLEVFRELGGPSAEAWGQTWTGISSTFRTLMARFSRVLTGDSFERLKRAMSSINAFLLRYRTNIENLLRAAGSVLGRIVDRAVTSSTSAFNYLVNNLDTIASKIDQTIQRVQTMMPLVARIAKGLAAFTVLTRVVGPLLSVAGAIGGMVSGLSGMSALFGGGAAASGGAGAAAGGAGAAAGAGGAMSALWAALSAAVAPLIAIILGVVGIFTALWRSLQLFGEQIVGLFAPLQGDLRAIWANLQDTFMSLWLFLEPILVLIGNMLFTGLGGALRFIVPVIRVATAALMILARVFRGIGDHLVVPVTQVSRRMFELVGYITRVFNPLRSFARLLELIGVGYRPSGMPGPGGTTPEVEEGTAFQNLLRGLRDIWNQPSPAAQNPVEGTGGAPTPRPTTNVDMRGSRINVRQEFREADPDRIWVQFREGLEREATQRISSGFVPALTR